jgi:SAM-dependent methyltransferase
VVDVGCGDGTWLKVFLELRQGLMYVLGLDGEYVRPHLQIQESSFQAVNLIEQSQHLEPHRLDLVEKRFDMALSLEVAEHLPESCAQDFVGSLTKLAPVVVFSAAIPFQGGIGHVNEQWPQYWVELFRPRGYVPVDLIRPSIWHNPEVEWWYAQNTFIFCDLKTLIRDRLLMTYYQTSPHAMTGRVHEFVHPRRYMLNAVAPEPGAGALVIHEP